MPRSGGSHLGPGGDGGDGEGEDRDRLRLIAGRDVVLGSDSSAAVAGAMPLDGIADGVATTAPTSAGTADVRWLASLHGPSLVSLVVALLTEASVVVCSASPVVASRTPALLRTLLAPFVWPHAFASLVPRRALLQLADGSAPFLLGLHASNEEAAALGATMARTPGVLVYDADLDLVYGACPHPRFPQTVLLVMEDAAATTLRSLRFAELADRQPTEAVAASALAAALAPHLAWTVDGINDFLGGDAGSSTASPDPYARVFDVGGWVAARCGTANDAQCSAKAAFLAVLAETEAFRAHVVDVAARARLLASLPPARTLYVLNTIPKESLAGASEDSGWVDFGAPDLGTLSEMLLARIAALVEPAGGVEVSAEKAAEIRVLPTYRSFVLATLKLRSVALHAASRLEIMVLALNLFNTLALHAAVEFAGNELVTPGEVARFVCYDVGGLHLSMHALEHGILRSSGGHGTPLAAAPWMMAAGRPLVALPGSELFDVLTLRSAVPGLGAALQRRGRTVRTALTVFTVDRVSSQLRRLAQALRRGRRRSTVGGV
ncbi:uncharacterized protein AMSG_03851 [Thecamonas trahens ATCC 50062]|uniref:UDENN domain-containing protein n=1 Tax=Thecamonas trahens ATCC 50062 TaxID=461836 RepID=A0A0L0D7Y3_THETB|nr:hypothetical protein AMSG_03851 [Thecamonas trahens ATCC 50062]KNC47418.1 hypothetical protein AMSG_03851 [Thecamonas trahens ATCC 50062]|eukprot:XP_013759754.1 hypothetical protein AMSG_03851 [Thecamonas trahens ATCC 50062]